MKKALSILFAIVIAITCAIPVAQPAYAATKMSESHVQAKISDFKKLFRDEDYFTVDGLASCPKTITVNNAVVCNGGTACKQCNIKYFFSSDIKNNNIKAAISQVPALNILKNNNKSIASCGGFAVFAFCYIFEHDYLTNSTIISTANTGITEKFLSALKPGDLIKCYKTMSSEEASHWAIYLSHDDKYVYFYESNSLRPNRIEYDNRRTRDGLKLYNWTKLVAFRSNNHTSKLTVNDAYEVTAADGFLAIRSTYSTSGTKRGEIPTGTVMTVTGYDKNGNWGKVNYNGIEGWCRLYDVKLANSNSSSNSSNSSNSSSTTTKPVNDIWLLSPPDDVLSMRTEATTSATKICNIPGGEYVSVTQYANDGKWDWGHVTYNGQSGWVCLYYATKHSAHSYGSWTITKKATCTVAGNKQRKCACGATETKTIDALGHSYSTSWTIDNAATCTTPGSKSYHCTVCSTKKNVTPIPATGHSYGQWITAKEATCTSTGEKQRKCACGTTETKQVEALGHSYSDSYIIENKPSCTQTGSKYRQCARCSAKRDTTAIPANGHSYSDWKTVQEAICTADGRSDRSCACGAKEYKAISSTGHKWGGWTVTKEATTDHTGEEARTCSLCSKQDAKAIPKLSADGHEHLFDDNGWVEITPANCTQDGRRERYCNLCNTEDVQVIPAISHTFSDWQTVSEPTTEQEGMSARTCTRCTHTEELPIPKLNTFDTTPSTDPAPPSDSTPVPPSDVAAQQDTLSENGAHKTDIPIVLTAVSLLFGAGSICTLVVTVVKKKKQ